MLSFKERESHKTFIIAHRGASAYEYENTLAAFRKAIDLQADAIELDIRKTKDDVLVVHHDAVLKNQIKPISEMTIGEIKDFNVRADYKVAIFEEVLSLCKDKISLDVELKEKGYEQAVVALALHYYKKENLMFSSFDKKTLQAIRTIDSQLCLGYLFYKPTMLKSIPDYVDFLLPNYTLCKAGYLKKLDTLDKPIIIWTIDKNKTKDKFKKKNIYALITNDPQE